MCLYNGYLIAVTLVITLNLTNKGKLALCVSDVMEWDRHIAYAVFLPKMFNLCLIMRKTAKFSLGDDVQDNWLKLWKKCQ